ncbi:hypothetical protein AOLI_G00143860 [Acnodon oligacanthus]
MVAGLLVSGDSSRAYGMPQAWDAAGQTLEKSRSKGVKVLGVRLSDRHHMMLKLLTSRKIHSGRREACFLPVDNPCKSEFSAAQAAPTRSELEPWRRILRNMGSGLEFPIQLGYYDALWPMSDDADTYKWVSGRKGSRKL